jgi:hypothetical protein
MIFDTGAILVHLRGNMSLPDSAVLAVQAAALQADVLLDSLQMPRLATPVPSAVNVVHESSSSSESSSEKAELDTDDEAAADRVWSS